MSDDLSLTAGFRHTDNETAGEQFNYRAGVIYRINESFVVKGLYATSFRSANLFERYVSSVPILKGNVDLQNEELKGVDIGLYYTGKQSKAAINYYRNNTENFIKRRPVDGVPTYVNLAEGEKTTGLEYEFTHFFSKSLSVFVNGSHSFSAEDGASGEDLKYVLDDLVNFGLTYKYNEKLTISTFNRYRSGWGDAASFSVYNLHLAYLMTMGEYDVKLSLSLDNVFDKSYEYAEFSRGRLATIPGGAPRRFLAAINLAF
jgi:outer membrane receptor protein involved in Fe transport